MAIKNFEHAQLVFTIAKSAVEMHDEVLAQYAKGRLNMDFAMINPPDDFNPQRIVQKLDAVIGDVMQFERRILTHTSLATFEEFRRLVYKAQNQLSELFQYMEIIDNSEYYIRIYEESGIGPQKKDKEEYNKQEQEQVLANIKLQHAKALEIFYETLSKLDIGEPSTITIPSLII